MVLFTVFSILGAIFGLFKWSMAGFAPLLLTSMVHLLVSLLGFILLRREENIGWLTHCLFLALVQQIFHVIYQSGGLSSPDQVLWLPILLVAFYLTARPAVATLWGGVVMIFAFVVVSMHQAGARFPQSLVVDAQGYLSIGMLFPLTLMVGGLAIIGVQRDRAIQSAQVSSDETRLAAQKAQDGEQRLSRVLTLAQANSAELSRVGLELDSSANVLHSKVADFSHSCESQARGAEDMTQQCELMGEGVEESNRFVGELQQKAQQVKQQAQLSSEKLSASTTAMARISDNHNEIMVVAELITSMADQTNLLALNASIEAARAGEYGRGFMVVADEVRNLSAKSNDSAIEIRSLLDRIQTDVGHGQQVIEQTVSALSSMISEISEITFGVSRLAELIQGQTHSIGSLERVCIAVSQGAIDTEGVSSYLARQATELSHQVVTLKQVASELEETIHAT